MAFANLAGLEEFRTANQTDPSMQAFQAKLVNLVGRQGYSVLNRVILPFPSR